MRTRVYLELQRGAMRRKKRGGGVQRCGESCLLSTVPREVHFLIHLVWLVLVGTRFVPEPLAGEHLLYRCCPHQHHSSGRAGQLPGQKNVHATEVRWPTNICDRRVVHPSPEEGSSWSVGCGQGKTGFSTWWSRQSQMTVHLLKSPVEFLGVEFSNIFCVPSTKWI